MQDAAARIGCRGSRARPKAPSDSGGGGTTLNTPPKAAGESLIGHEVLMHFPMDANSVMSETDRDQPNSATTVHTRTRHENFLNL